jgi:DNA-binding LytR/AlgR family response regulator
VDEILYLFAGYSPSRGLIDAAWVRAQILRRDRLYLRTAKDLFVTSYRSLASLEGALDPRQFVRIHQSITVNLLKIAEIDEGGKRKRVAVIAADGTKEWLAISRRSLPPFRILLGMPGRRAAGGT